jgi:hypothetical protein
MALLVFPKGKTKGQRQQPWVFTCSAAAAGKRKRLCLLPALDAGMRIEKYIKNFEISGRSKS